MFAKKAALARELAKDRNRPVKEICDLLNISRTTFYTYTASAAPEEARTALSD